MSDFENILSGGDRRSIGKSNAVVNAVRKQQDFDTLFDCLYHNDRLVIMRAADAIEKITIRHPEYLVRHKEQIFSLCHSEFHIELLWHLALLLPRLPLNEDEFGIAWDILNQWARDKNNSRVVRVNAIQALFDLLPQNMELKKDYELLLDEIYGQSIASLAARIRIIRSQIKKM
jgi:hypothetical protein